NGSSAGMAQLIGVRMTAKLPSYVAVVKFYIDVYQVMGLR
ncbi:MAG: hypothetical protein QOH91_4402, partial [Mycobacterium sp.]|nr:hypothetical protein [Mycobacterium sp.]